MIEPPRRYYKHLEESMHLNPEMSSRNEEHAYSRYEDGRKGTCMDMRLNGENTRVFVGQMVLESFCLKRSEPTIILKDSWT